MERILIRHLKGSRAGRVDQFSIDTMVEIVLGRDASSTIAFDPVQDDVVGRRHARIARHEGDRNRFVITDLSSRNGTFVNRQRISTSAVLSPGDVVQLGAGGPEFQFDVDPPAAVVLDVTRVVARPDAGATKDARRQAAGASTRATRAWEGVGRATVSRMIGAVRSGHARKNLAAMATAAVGVVAAVVSLVTAHGSPFSTSPTPATLAQKYVETNVFVEASWKLVHTRTGSQIFHEYGRRREANGRWSAWMPVYVQLPDGTIEPALAPDPGPEGKNRPIGGTHVGSGFVVTADGFILTNRHVAAAWETSYTGFPDRPGLLVDLNNPQADPKELREAPRDWVPAAAKVFGRSVVGKRVEGTHTYLDVTFAKNRLRIPATVARVSDAHDVAMIKIQTPKRLAHVELKDTYDTVAVGQGVTIMGYPAASPMVAVSTRSDDPFSPQAQTRVVPDPTVTPASISRILRGRIAANAQTLEYRSEMGDAYQLSAEPGAGNSGGPVFDQRGRVIAIFTSGDGSMGFAVPIRYGLELMGITPVM